MDRKKKNIIELTRIGVDEYREMRKIPLSVMADNVRSAQNIGSLLRTADAFMLNEVIMAGISAVPPNAEISKTALGAERSVAWRYVEDAFEEVKRLKNTGTRIYALEQTHGSIPLDKLTLFSDDEYVSENKEYSSGISIGREKKRISGFLLVVGNEVKGVDQRIVDIADATLEIPMHGVKHSLNVSVSAGIAMWELYKRLVESL